MRISVQTLVAATLSLVCLAASPWAMAQPVPSAAELHRALNLVMEKVGSGDLEGGLKLLKTRTVIPETEFDAMEAQARLQQPVMRQRFGGKLGAEFLREDKLGESLMRYTYIDRFDRHAMRWVFYTYRGKEGWVVDTFRFDDQLSALFP